MKKPCPVKILAETISIFLDFGYLLHLLGTEERIRRLLIGNLAKAEEILSQLKSGATKSKVCNKNADLQNIQYNACR